ncbi:MAG TPA: hypothetical protein VL652_05640 [Kutzneria sp.]|nr:hypothetical protein [Kutzneria sp.]
MDVDSGAAVRGDNTGITSSGDHAINIQVMPSALVRTQYRQQVKRIAPPALFGRESELAELADFCAGATGYAWWRAEAWSGKTALMSWFVLHPPENVQIVSFFVTARLAAQDDRNAFIENVLEQLLALLGESMPPRLTESTREAHLLGRLDAAARGCRARGQHFVLLVDGLDEDRTGHEHSIAALLPADLPAGMHVIVAGRPNPPVPEDVPDHHPLRSAAIIRLLAPSPQARAMGVEMKKDLKRLVTGATAEQEVLGLVTSAVGGLTAADLVQLTGLLPWQIDECLHTVSGRSFSSRPSSCGAEAFLLGHEELQLMAASLLGPLRLASYRSRLHAWAQDFRSRHWPSDTPEYLLRGYFRMLKATSAHSELVSCAIDIRRQDRLLALTGGDAAALAEITTAMEALAVHDEPDLVAMTRLAIHRDRVTSRNSNMPTELPAAWALLGEVDRAESIANSISSLDDRVAAFVRLAETMATTGHSKRAADLLARAERDAHALTNYFDLAAALGKVAAAIVATTDDVDRAEAIVAAIPWPDERAKETRTVAAAMVAAGHVERAETLVNSVDEPIHLAEALVPVAAGWAAAGNTQRYMDIRTRLGNLFRRRLADDFDTKLEVLASLATELARTGASELAVDLAHYADDVAEKFADTDDARFDIVTGMIDGLLVEVWAATGDLGRAADIAWRIKDADERVGSLVVVGREQGRAGHTHQARDTLGHVELLCREGRHHRLLAVVEAYVVIGDIDQAARLADSIASPMTSAAALAMVGKAEALAGRRDKASGFLLRAESSARSAVVVTGETLAGAAEELARAGAYAPAGKVVDRVVEVASFETGGVNHVLTLRHLATALALRGDLDRTEQVCSASSSPASGADALATAGESLAKAGRIDEATDAFRRAKRLARTDCRHGERTSAFIMVVRSLIAAGDFLNAEATARAMAGREMRAGLLARVATGLAETDSGERAIEVLKAVERIVRTCRRTSARDEAAAALTGVLALVGDTERLSHFLLTIADDVQLNAAMAAVARAHALGGRIDQAEEIISVITDLDQQSEALAKVARAAASVGHVDRAVDISAGIVDPFCRATALRDIAGVLAGAGDLDRAKEIANMITDTEHRAQALLTVLRAKSVVDRREVAEVLVLGKWFKTIPEVVGMAPDALEEIMDELTT